MKLILSLAAALGLCAARLPAQIPQMIHYQGRIVAGSTNFEGAGLFKFALLGTNETGAIVSLWSNNGSSVGGAEPSAAVNIPVVKGLYSALLGDASLPNMQPVPPAVFATPAVFLRVWFNDGASGFQQLAPDQRLSSVGFAMVAGTVPDAAITPPKLSPGLAGQVLMTDESGRANWAPAASVVAHAAVDDPDAVATADPAENTCLIQIEGLFTNEVVICGGISMELDTELRTPDPSYSTSPYVWVVPSENLRSYSKFVFEYSGVSSNMLAAGTNDNPRVPRDIIIIIRNALGNEQCRWTLPLMEMERVIPGSDGRQRYVFRPQLFGNGLYDSPQIVYQRTPDAFSFSSAFRAGYDDYFIEIEGESRHAPEKIEIDTRNRTFTMTVVSSEFGKLYQWFSRVSTQRFGVDMSLRSMSTIKLQRMPDGGVAEVGRYNYYEVIPIRYEVVTGFGQFERLKERIVFKFMLRDMG